jgi:DNA-binding LacI/PurR family transcriptional regulator
MNVTGHTRGDPRNRTVSIRDVAAAAGVSYQTVSRVINGHPSVRPETRELVVNAIEQLGFRPNRAARALAGGPVQSVTVLTDNTTLYGRSESIRGIEEAARAAGFTVGIRVVETEDQAEISDAVSRATEPRGALIVIAHDRVGDLVLDAVPGDVPMVALVGTPAGAEGDGRPWVWIDDRQAAFNATRYLLGLGHRTVYYAAIPSSPQRLQGWREALETKGAPVPDPVICGWTPHSGYLAGLQLGAREEVTAILCGNDDLAIGVTRALREAGRAVPAEVSVIGFDDIPVAQFLTPALTTVRQDFAQLGRVAFAMLRSRIEPDAAIDMPEAPEPELVIRESAGPPPAEGAAS